MKMDVPPPQQSPPPSRSRGLPESRLHAVPLSVSLPLPSPSGSTFPPSPPLRRPPGFPAPRRPALLGARSRLRHGRPRGDAAAQEEGQQEAPSVGAAAARPGRQGEGQVRVALAGLPRFAQGETEAKKRRLERINQRKLGLLAEVKFLRKKYSSFANDDSEQTHHRLKKKKAKQIPSTLGINEGPSTSKNTNVDLNHDSAMNAEGAYCQGYQDHPESGKHDQAGVDEDVMTSNVNLSVYRDTENSPASDDKRATAWQDRVALQV